MNNQAAADRRLEGGGGGGKQVASKCWQPPNGVQGDKNKNTEIFKVNVMRASHLPKIYILHFAFD